MQDLQSKIQSLARPIGLGSCALAILVKMFLPEAFVTGFITGFLTSLSITFLIYYFITNRKRQIN